MQEVLLAPVLFAATSATMLLLQVQQQNSSPTLTLSALSKVNQDLHDSGSDIDIEQSPHSTIDSSLPIPGLGIPRSDSEFSLGLNRSTSVADTMNQLGLCDSGHAAVFVARIVLYSSMLVYATRYLAISTSAASGSRGDAGGGGKPA